VCPKANPIRDSDTQNNHLLDPLDARMRGERAIGLDLGRLTTISLVIAWFNLRLLMDAHCPLRDMVKFRKSAVNAGSRDQLASSYRRHILGRRFLLYLGLRLEMAMTKSVGPRPEPCTILALMVQRGEIAEGKKLLTTRGYGGASLVPPSGGGN